MPRTPPSEVDLATRFWLRTAYVDPRSNECMAWMGHRLPTGSGQLRGPDGRVPYAHRLAFELTVGDIPPGAVVRHLCHHPWCVRPSHLTIGTHAQNAADKVQAGRTRVIERPCPDTVAAVRHLFASQRFSQGEIALMVFGTGTAQPHVSRICSGKAYRDAPGPITRRGRGNPPTRRSK